MKISLLLDAHRPAFRPTDSQLSFFFLVLRFTQILKGTYCHRALLFKFLADTVKLPTALVRGQYGRVYNVMYTRGMIVTTRHCPQAHTNWALTLCCTPFLQFPDIQRISRTLRRRCHAQTRRPGGYC